ncbi:MAG: hypothetical protein EXS31_09735 [Pedosphaera sp.]|nr:hypothetical protein [Pedosphaera sp.]
MRSPFALTILSLLACNLSASALSYTINEDSNIRLDFTIHWDKVAPGEEIENLPPAEGVEGSFLMVHDHLDSLDPFLYLAFSDEQTGFIIDLVDGGRSFGELVGFNGVQSFPEQEDQTTYAYRFVFGSSLPAVVSDSGNTLCLLAGAVSVLSLCGLRRARSVNPRVE